LCHFIFFSVCCASAYDNRFYLLHADFIAKLGVFQSEKQKEKKKRKKMEFHRPRFSLRETEIQQHLLGESRQPEAEGLIGGGDQIDPRGLVETVYADEAGDGTVDGRDEDDSNRFVM
jgi:hypothetical protein